MYSAFEFEARIPGGQTRPLSQYAGRVLLIVNTASQCGFTPQYAGLQALHEKYHAQGLSVLAFPCNQFGAQEPGSAAEIAQFCESRFRVGFDLFDKVEVNGPTAAPLFRWLCAEAPGVLGSRAIKWNFTKFLIRRDGSVAGRFAPMTAPAKLESRVQSLLAIG